MRDSEYTGESPWDNEETFQEDLKAEFYICIRQIRYNRINIFDDELGPVTEVVHDGVSEILYGEIKKNKKLAGPSPKAAAERALKIITIFLDNDWKIPVEMREYLSSNFKKAIGNSGSSLQSLFHLRSDENNVDRASANTKIANYILFRRRVNNEIKKVTNSKYLRASSLDEMLCDEINHIFNLERKINKDKLKRVIEYGQVILSSQLLVIDFLNANIRYLNAYKNFLIGELEDDNKKKADKNKEESEWRKIRTFTLNWIEKETKKDGNQQP